MNAKSVVPPSLPAVERSTDFADFSRRRNWSQNIIDEQQDFLHVITPAGAFIYASPNSGILLGYPPDELCGKLITEFIHPDDVKTYVDSCNAAASLNHKFHLVFRFHCRNDSYVILECNGHPQFNDQGSHCKCFFMMGRIYPTKNTAMLDSFLKLKTENELLRTQILELSTQTASRFETSSESPGQFPSAFSGHQGIILPHHHTGTLLDNPVEAVAKDIVDRSAIDTIEMLTGYQSGDHPLIIERPSSLVTSGESICSLPMQPNIADGATNAPVQLDGPERPRKKNRKVKLPPDEYVCASCGTTDSPEWRKGPMGPKTLCNACGLRWAKREKKHSRLSDTNLQVPNT